ncbi:MAG: hypothetical protein ABIJ34_08175 [archaeon]
MRNQNKSGYIEFSANFLVRLVFGIMLILVIISFFARIPFISDQTVIGRLVLFMSILAIMEAIIHVLMQVGMGS